jgi:hypothetical protein
MIRELIDDMKQMTKADWKASIVFHLVIIGSMVMVGIIERW